MVAFPMFIVFHIDALVSKQVLTLIRRRLLHCLYMVPQTGFQSKRVNQTTKQSTEVSYTYHTVNYHKQLHSP